MLKDLNNINSKIINHKCHEINKIHRFLTTNDNLDINNENMNEDVDHDDDDDDDNESTFEVVECDTNVDTNVDKSKNYIVKEVTKYCIMILQIIKKIHDKGILHRDIKPENIMIDLIKSDNGFTEKRVYLIDFGHSSLYISDEKHIINLKMNFQVGTRVFMSKNIHEGNDYSRRDDIISILYTVIYLIKGALPWDGLPTSYDIKSILTTEEICLGIPSVFKKLLDYAYSLKFEDRPDYSYMIRQCKHLLRTL
jgi:serine/threonine protein kinase